MEKTGIKSVFFLVLPSSVLLVFVFAVPLLSLVYYSLTSWEFINAGPPFGLHNYTALTRDPNLLAALSRTIIVGGVTIPITVMISVIVAHFLYERVLGWQVYLVIFFIPIILPIVVIGTVFTHFYTLKGPLNYVLRSIGLGMFTRAWLTDLKTALPSIILAAVWWEISFATIIFYARMMTISPSLYEAAQVDGASQGQLIFHITLPQLRGVIQFYVVLAIIYFFNQSFTFIFVMTYGGPGWATTTIDFFIYLNAFKHLRLGIASAISLLLSIAILALVQVYLSLTKGEEIQ